MILTIPRTQAPALPESGCWPVADLGFIQPPVWQARADAEHDERFLQPIVYLVLRNPQGLAWCYQRVGGDARLDGRCSMGVGGHVDAADSTPPDHAPLDAAATLHRALLRELSEELLSAPGHAACPGDLRGLCLQGLIYEGLSAVGRVHLGVLYTAQWLPTQAPQPHAGEKLTSQGFLSLADIATDARFELWSRLAARHLLTKP